MQQWLRAEIIIAAFRRSDQLLLILGGGQDESASSKRGLFIKASKSVCVRNQRLLHGAIAKALGERDVLNNETHAGLQLDHLAGVERLRRRICELLRCDTVLDRGPEW